MLRIYSLKNSFLIAYNLGTVNVSIYLLKKKNTFYPSLSNSHKNSNSK